MCKLCFIKKKYIFFIAIFFDFIDRKISKLERYFLRKSLRKLKLPYKKKRYFLASLLTKCIHSKLFGFPEISKLERYFLPPLLYFVTINNLNLSRLLIPLSLNIVSYNLNVLLDQLSFTSLYGDTRIRTEPSNMQGQHSTK